MHLALQIPEILLLIFEEVDRPTLIAATRCCRMFSEAALDVLWQGIGPNGFTSLLRNLPIHQIHKSTKKHYQILQGVTSDNIWARFYNYTRRVRVFYNGHPGEIIDTIHPSVYLHLARRFQFIFPHLTHFNLNLEYLDDETGIGTLLCLPPSLRYLDLSYYSAEYYKDEKYIVGAIFDEIPNTAPDIVVLRVDLYLPDTYIDKVILMKHLRTLRLSEMTITAEHSWLHRLPMLTSLTDITLSVINIPEPDLSLPLDWRGLTNLRSLTMRGSLKNFAYILAALPADQLHTLKLTTSDRLTLGQDSWPRTLWKELHSCFGLISRHYSLHGIILDLQTLEFHDNVTRADMTFPPFQSIIQPLLSLQPLRIAIFRAFPPVDLSGNDLSICAHSWPDIEVLEFPFTLCTMLSLDTVKTTIFSRSHKLTRLGVALDRLDYPVGLKQKPWSTILTSLRVHISVSSDPDAAAASLLQLFPGLRRVCPFTYDRNIDCTMMCDRIGMAIRALRGEKPESHFFDYY